MLLITKQQIIASKKLPSLHIQEYIVTSNAVTKMDPGKLILIHFGDDYHSESFDVNLSCLHEI